MDPTSLSVASSSFHLNASYVSSASDHLTESARVLQSILQHRKLPARGLSEHHISLIMHQIAAMDSNNFHTQLGAGEREGRCISSLVSRRHYGLSHGIGRSGELTAQQPKAIGSSLLQQLTTALALDAVHLAGCTAMTDCLLLPVATGMSLSLALLALAGSGQGEREGGGAADRPRFVLLPRIDQKSCIKCIQQANLVPVVLPNLLLPAAASSSAASSASPSPSHTATDLALLEQTVARLGASSIACVLSVTSCFAPRAPDDVEGIARLCSRLGVAHVINHAYGLQSPQLCAAVDRACRRGRVDAVVQSMDKNFLVPVGGAVVCSCSTASPSGLLRRISGLYPGRASSSSLTDLLIALLHLGRDGFVSLIQRRVSLHGVMRQRLQELAERHALPMLGSMLFSRGVSGMRCVAPGQLAEVSGVRLAGWGGHSDGWAGGFLCMACAIGMTEEEMEAVMSKLDKCWLDWQRRQQKQQQQS